MQGRHVHLGDPLFTMPFLSTEFMQSIPGVLNPSRYLPVPSLIRSPLYLRLLLLARPPDDRTTISTLESFAIPGIFCLALPKTCKRPPMTTRYVSFYTEATNLPRILPPPRTVFCSLCKESHVDLYMLRTKSSNCEACSSLAGLTNFHPRCQCL